MLLIGIGRSEAIEVLYSKGFRDIVAIDISPTIIHKMQVKYSSYSGVEFLVMDARELSYFNDETFSLVIDKGCLDALFCGTDYLTSSEQFCKEIHRVMRKNAFFLCISYATPIARVPYLRRQRWAVDTCPLPGGEGVTMFVLNKTEDEKLLTRKVAGGEAAVMARSSNIVSKMDQTMNKSSTVRNKSNTGSVTVTSSIDMIAEMVDESEDTDR